MGHDLKPSHPLQTRDGTSSLSHVRSTKSGQTSKQRGVQLNERFASLPYPLTRGQRSKSAQMRFEHL